MAPAATVVDAMLTPAEVADQFRVTTGYLCTRRFEGKGPEYVKVGNAVRYRASVIAAWIEENTHNTEALG